MWTLEQATKCPRCGTRPEEWVEDHNAYFAETIHCLGCEKLQIESEMSRESEEKGTRQVLKSKQQLAKEEEMRALEKLAQDARSEASDS